MSEKDLMKNLENFQKDMDMRILNLEKKMELIISLLKQQANRETRENNRPIYVAKRVDEPRYDC